MELDLTQLDPAGRNVHERFEARELRGDGESEAERIEPLRATLEARVRPERGGAQVTGEIEADARAECDRCLKPVQIRVEGRFDQRYVWGEPPTDLARDLELDPEELDVELLERGVLDTCALAREQIELNAPARVVCDEACAGLCPTCGADLNAGPCGCDQSEIDPRWEALKKFKT